MDEFKNYLINECVNLYIRLNYRYSYENNEQGTFERLKDIIKYEQLLEIVRNNPVWDAKEMGREISEIIRERTSL